jgi:hypothetical protein
MKGRTLSFFALATMVLLATCNMRSASAASFSLWGTSDFDNCVKLTENVGRTNYDYRLYWSLVDDHIEIGLAAKVGGWLGLGISTDGSMSSGGSGSDVWVGFVGASFPACAEGCVLDYWADSTSQPALDSHSDMKNVSVGSIDGYTWVRFARLLVTGDPKDRDITPDVSQHVIHALGSTLPSSTTSFDEHIIGTNSQTDLQFGQAQWTCNDTVPTPDGPSAINSYENPAKTWRVNWTLIDDGQSIEYNVSAQTGSWWALGINENENMVGADILWCSFDGENATVVDRKATARETPGSDAVQNVELVSAERVNGWSTCRLRRKLDTGDAQGDNVISNKLQNLLWAYAPSSDKRSMVERDCPDFCQHASNTKGIASVNFITGASSDVTTTDDKRKAHGILMLFAWGLVAVAGAFIARYCKTPQGKWVLYGYVWVHLHGFLGVLTFVVNLIAFALIVNWVSDRGIDHFKGAHEVIGIIMFICTFFQPLVGIIGELFLKKYKDPNWVGYLIGTTHAWFGKALVLLGLVEVYLGLALYCVPTYVMVTYGVSVACMIALFLIHEVLRWFAPWGSWLGGPGFTYQRVEDDSGSTEMKDFSPENKIPWMNKRAPQQPPLVVKVCLWILQVGLAVIIIGLWIATAVGIGEKDINDPNDSYDSTCVIGTKFQ